ncbi:MAG: hypothetical protein P8Y79_14920 [Ignavibacteriaceae bacterium]
MKNRKSKSNLFTTILLILTFGIILPTSLLKNDTEKSDSSDSVDESSQIIRNNKFDSFNSKFQKAKDNIPVNLILGIKKEKAFISEKTYLVGVSVRF